MGTALEHLIQVLGIAQTPQDFWTREDRQAVRDAREFVQRERGQSESQGTKGRGGEAGGSERGAGAEKATGSFQGEGVSLQEGEEDPG